MLSTQLPFVKIAGDMVSSRYPVKLEASSIRWKRGTSSASSPLSRHLGVLDR
jgi:hypothetical protein